MRYAENPRSLMVDGERLRALRLALELTQEEAASRSGYSDRLIRKLEGGGPVNLQTLQDVLATYAQTSAKIGNVALNELIVEEQSPEMLINYWFERVYNQRDLAAVQQLMHPEVVIVSEGESRQGREFIRQRVESVLAAFNPLKLTVERVVTGPDHAVAYWHVVKTHVGDFLGIPATHKEVELRGSSYGRFENNVIVEVRDHWDVHDLIQQLTGDPGKPV